MNWLPWWLSGKEPACQCRLQGFEPWSGAVGHLRLCPTILSMCSRVGAAKPESTCCLHWSLLGWEPSLHNKRNHRTETHTHHSQREAPACHKQRKIPRSNEHPDQPETKINNIINTKFKKLNGLSQKHRISQVHALLNSSVVRGFRTDSSLTKKIAFGEIFSIFNPKFVFLHFLPLCLKSFTSIF